MRVPGMKLAYAVCPAGRSFRVAHRFRALRMRFGVILGRTEIDLRILAGTLAYTRLEIVSIHPIRPRRR